MSKLHPKVLFPAIIVAAGLIAAAIWHFAPATGGLPPAELAADATARLTALNSVTFHTDTRLDINGESVSLGSIDGQICGNDLHICGNVLGSDTNIYQIGGTTYRQDTLTEQWLTTDDGELLTNPSLLTDADPREFFRLAQLGDVTEGAAQEIGGEKCRCISFVPSSVSGELEKYFDEIACTIWVTRGGQIARSEISASATSAGQTSTLTLTCDFSAWDDTAPITPPIVQPAA